MHANEVYTSITCSTIISLTWSMSPLGVAGLLCPTLPIVCIIYEHTECVGACTSYQDHQCVDQSQ